MAAKRKWRQTRTQHYFIDFKAKKNHLNFLIKRARTAYYQQFIEDNNSNQQKLFAASKQLLNMNLDLVFPLCTDEKTLANDIATFFTQKIEKIRLNLGSNITITDVFDQLHSVNTAIRMMEFKYLTETEIRVLVESAAKK